MFGLGGCQKTTNCKTEFTRSEHFRLFGYIHTDNTTPPDRPVTGQGGGRGKRVREERKTKRERERDRQRERGERKTQRLQAERQRERQRERQTTRERGVEKNRDRERDRERQRQQRCKNSCKRDTKVNQTQATIHTQKPPQTVGAHIRMGFSCPYALLENCVVSTAEDMGGGRGERERKKGLWGLE